MKCYSAVIYTAHTDLHQLKAGHSLFGCFIYLFLFMNIVDTQKWQETETLGVLTWPICQGEQGCIQGYMCCCGSRRKAMLLSMEENVRYKVLFPSNHNVTGDFWPFPEIHNTRCKPHNPFGRAALPPRSFCRHRYHCDCCPLLRGIVHLRVKSSN